MHSRLPSDQGTTQHDAENVEVKPRRPQLSFLFLCLGALSGMWVLVSRAGFPVWHGFPNTASVTLLSLAAVAVSRGNAPAPYKWSIALGLSLSAIGDAFLMLPGDRFIQGLCSFLAAQVCYLWAFTSDARLAERKIPFLICGLFAILLLVVLWPGVAGPLRLPVLAYAVALMTMAAQAIGGALVRPGAGTILAGIGAALFVISDSVLAFQRFRYTLDWGRGVVLGTYFCAQGSIALSVLMKRLPPERIASCRPAPLRAPGT